MLRSRHQLLPEYRLRAASARGACPQRCWPPPGHRSQPASASQSANRRLVLAPSSRERAPRGKSPSECMSEPAHVNVGSPREDIWQHWVWHTDVSPATCAGDAETQFSPRGVRLRARKAYVCSDTFVCRIVCEGPGAALRSPHAMLSIQGPICRDDLTAWSRRFANDE